MRDTCLDTINYSVASSRRSTRSTIYYITTTTRNIISILPLSALPSLGHFRVGLPVGKVLQIHEWAQSIRPSSIYPVLATHIPLDYVFALALSATTTSLGHTSFLPAALRLLPPGRIVPSAWMMAYAHHGSSRLFLVNYLPI